MALGYNVLTNFEGPSSAGPYAGPVSGSRTVDEDLLLVKVSVNRGTVPTITVTYNSVSMTSILKANHAATSSAPTTEWFLLESPAAGSNTLSVSLSSSVNSYVIEAVAVSGHKSGDVIGNTASVVGLSDTVSLNITTGDDGNDLVMGCNFRAPFDASPITEGIGITELADATSAPAGGNINVASGVYKKTVVTAGSDTIDCTASSSERRVGAAFELKVATGAPTASLLLMQQSFRQGA